MLQFANSPAKLIEKYQQYHFCSSELTYLHQNLSEKLWVSKPYTIEQFIYDPP